MTREPGDLPQRAFLLTGRGDPGEIASGGSAALVSRDFGVSLLINIGAPLCRTLNIPFQQVKSLPWLHFRSFAVTVL